MWTVRHKKYILLRPKHNFNNALLNLKSIKVYWLYILFWLWKYIKRRHKKNHRFAKDYWGGAFVSYGWGLNWIIEQMVFVSLNTVKAAAESTQWNLRRGWSVSHREMVFYHFVERLRTLTWEFKCSETKTHLGLNVVGLMACVVVCWSLSNLLNPVVDHKMNRMKCVVWEVAAAGSLTFGLGDGAANGGAGGGDGAHRRAHAIRRVHPGHGRRVGNPRCWVNGPDRLACSVTLETTTFR